MPKSQIFNVIQREENVFSLQEKYLGLHLAVTRETPKIFVVSYKKRFVNLGLITIFSNYKVATGIGIFLYFWKMLNILIQYV